MKAMDILAGDHRQRFFGFRSFSLDVYYIDSSPREPRFVLVPLRFASEAWPRAGLGEPRSASNANKPASSWPLKQGRKKCSKHGCALGTSTVQICPKNFKSFSNCSPSHTLFQDRFYVQVVSRWFSTLASSHQTFTKKGLRMTQVDQSWWIV